jgi:hypothetical protein
MMKTKIQALYTKACSIGRQAEAAMGSEQINLQARLGEIKNEIRETALAGAVDAERQRCLELYSLCQANQDPRAEAGSASFGDFLARGTDLEQAAGFLRAASGLIDQDAGLLQAAAKQQEGPHE